MLSVSIRSIPCSSCLISPVTRSPLISQTTSVFSLNSGNTDSSNAKLKADTTVKFPDHRHIGEVTVFREQQSGVTTREQSLFNYDYHWFYRDPWFFGARLSFERDPIIELDQRIILSAGIGRDIWNTPLMRPRTRISRCLLRLAWSFDRVIQKAASASFGPKNGSLWTMTYAV